MMSLILFDAVFVNSESLRFALFGISLLQELRINLVFSSQARHKPLASQALVHQSTKQYYHLVHFHFDSFDCAFRPLVFVAQYEAVLVELIRLQSQPAQP